MRKGQSIWEVVFGGANGEEESVVGQMEKKDGRNWVLVGEWWKNERR